MRNRLYAAVSLALGGTTLVGMGIYFAFVRPSLLPEDMRYMGATLVQVHAALPGLEAWLQRVFGVLGGYMFAMGLLTIHVAATSFKSGRPGATVVVALSGLSSIGWMAGTNFAIGSDFKWLLLAFTMPWIIALALAWSGKRGHSP